MGSLTKKLSTVAHFYPGIFRILSKIGTNYNFWIYEGNKNTVIGLRAPSGGDLVKQKMMTIY